MKRFLEIISIPFWIVVALIDLFFVKEVDGTKVVDNLNRKKK
jgi:hypothetical protein